MMVDSAGSTARLSCYSPLSSVSFCQYDIHYLSSQEGWQVSRDASLSWQVQTSAISHSLRPKHVICGKMFLQQVNTKIYTNASVKPADCEPDSEEIFKKEEEGNLIDSLIPAFKSYFLDLLTHSIPRCHFENPLPSLFSYKCFTARDWGRRVGREEVRPAGFRGSGRVWRIYWAVLTGVQS